MARPAATPVAESDTALPMAEGSHGTCRLSGAAPGAPALSVEHLQKTYVSARGARVTALQDVSFTLEPGAFVSVVGPSGCGKSTLLRIIAGLLDYESGRVAVSGEEVRTQPRRDVGVVFQQPALLPWRTVRENVQLPLKIRREPARGVDALLRMVGMAEFDRHYPHELSGGMQQRTAIVRALVTNPRVLLLDEPFGALDALTRERLNLELNRIWRETHKTILLITHSIQEAVFLSDRILVMSRRPGQIVADHQVPFSAEREAALMGTREFAEHSSHVRSLLYAQGDLES